VTTRIWISYDLGIEGDYDSLYSWLDGHQAKECGANVATLVYPSEGNLIATLKSDLSRATKLKPRSRLYVVYCKEGVVHGKFLYGGRISPRWSGFAGLGAAEEDSG
jgi:hypothetical protein